MAFSIKKYETPYNDNKLEYDFDQHRYKLTTGFITSRYKDVALNDKIDELIEAVSDNVYLYIYSFKTGYQEFNKMEYELAKNQYFREWIAEALIRQFEYAYSTSGDVVNLQHGIDINNNKNIKIEDIRNELLVSYKTILILQQHDMLLSTVDYTEYDDEKWRVDY